MQTTIHQQVFANTQTRNSSHLSLWKRFIHWADGQEKYRFGWTAGILAGHGCVATVITMAAIVFTGNHFILWPFAIAAMAACVVVNLAAMPTKITIPVFFFSLLVDLALIAICIANGFDISGTYV
ncbi:MAG: hypothetical protein ACT4OJ_02435 [Bacteroidota bacterium]